MNILVGIGINMMVAMNGGPPERPFLHGGATQ
jgi:hypothetical protein